MGVSEEQKKEIKTAKFEEEVKNLGFPSVEELFAGIGAGEVRAQQVIGKLFPDLVVKVPEKPPIPAPQKPDKLQRQKAAKKGPQIIVGGIESALVKVSHCCNPIPGDAIIGYITRGRGVTVHRADCPNAKELLSKGDGRMIEVKWDMVIQTNSEVAYPARIRVETADRTGMLNSVTSIISGQGLNIVSASAKTTKKQTGILEFTLEVRSSLQLQSLIKSLLRLNGVSKVYRVDIPDKI